MNEPRVSIIVPVYNGEKYLGKCIESILNQSYHNLNIIIVNDGSSDNSDEIIRKYDNTDPRIVYICQENKGPSLARNAGIEKSDGDIIIFLDCDDYFDLDTVEKIVSKFEDDIGIIMYPFVREYGNRKEFVPLFDEKEIIFQKEDILDRLLGRILGPTDVSGRINVLEMDRLNPCCMKAYRKEILNNVRFVDTKEIWMEDGWFVLNAFYNMSKKALYTSDVIYHYNKANNQSFLHTYNKSHFRKRWNLYKKELEFISKHSECQKYLINIANRIVFELYAIVFYIVSSNIGFRNKLDEISKVLNFQEYQKWYHIAEINKLSWIWRVFYTMCKKRMALSILVVTQLLIKIVSLRRSF